MPTIPQYSDQSQRVRTEALPGARVSTEAPLEAFGGGQSAQALSTAAEGAVGAFEKVAIEQKNQADQIVHLKADTDLTNQKTQIQLNISNLQGEDAIGAPDKAFVQFDKVSQQIGDGLNNPQQKAAFQRSVMQQRAELYKSSLLHESSEKNKFEEMTFQKSQQAYHNAAVLNAGDPELVAQNLNNLAAVKTDQLNRQGIHDPNQRNTMMIDALSPAHRDVIEQMLQSGLTDAARQSFEKNKSQMNPADIKNIQTALATQTVIKDGNDKFDQSLSTPGMRFSDGTINIEKLKSSITPPENLSESEKKTYLDFIGHKASEFNVNKSKQDQSMERSFTNEVNKAVANKVPYAKAVEIASRYAVDPTDLAQKVGFVGKTYAPPSESDPDVYLNLKERTLRGEDTKADIVKAHNANQINNSAYIGLNEMTFDQKINGTNPQLKLANERVKMLADRTFGEKKSDAKTQFLYDVSQSTQGKSPDEMYKIANDKLKDDPTTGNIFGWFQDRQYEKSFKESDANSLAMGVVHEEVGAPTVKSLQQALFKMNGKPAGLKEIDQMAQQLGGYDNIKKGTPANNAINSLSRRSMPVTVKNINAVLQKFPDGNY